MNPPRRATSQNNPSQDVARSLTCALIKLNDQVRPFHEFLAGQRAHFLSQDYSDDEARAMAAALFVSIFGGNISRTIADEDVADSPPEQGGGFD